MRSENQSDPGDETVAAGPTIEELNHAAVKAAFGRLGITVDEDGEKTPEQFVAALNDLADRAEQSESRIAELEKQVSDAQAKLVKATTAAKAGTAKGRKVDPSLAPADGVDEDGEAVPAGQVLLGKLAAAGEVELVGLDAKHREIAGFTQAISGGAEAFRATGNGVRLALPRPLEVTAPGDRRSEIHAWGLVIDGKPAAYGKRFEPLVLMPGQRTDLSNDVIF